MIRKIWIAILAICMFCISACEAPEGNCQDTVSDCDIEPTIIIGD